MEYLLITKVLYLIVVSLLEFELTINFLNPAFLLLVNDQTYGRNKAIVEHNYLLGTGFLTKILSFQNTRHFARNTKYLKFNVRKT